MTDAIRGYQDVHITDKKLKAEQDRKAMLFTAENAIDADDLRDLLQKLGLIPTPEADEKRALRASHALKKIGKINN